MDSGHVTVLAGGAGAAKFILGLVQALPEEQVHVICNVGDDCEMWGLYACPDIDRVLHTLAGEMDPYREADPGTETYHCLNRIRKLGMPSWFRISDRDMATLLVRSSLLREAKRLDEATSRLADLFGLGSVIMPATNDPVRTRIRIGEELVPFREYMSRNGHGEAAGGVTYDQASGSSPAPGVIQSIREASRVILAPGDPVTHIGPILAIPGIREGLAQTRAAVVAISPVIGSIPAGAATSPVATSVPPMSVRSVAERYRDFVDHIVMHTSDLACLEEVQQVGVGVSVENILIQNGEDAERLAGRMLSEDRFTPGKVR